MSLLANNLIRPKALEIEHILQSCIDARRSPNIKINRKEKMLNGPTVAFAVCEPFDFPKPSLLMASQQHETWHVIYYSVHVPCYLSPLHMAPVVSRHPNPFPKARGCFCGNHYIAPLPQRNGVTMMSNHSQSRLSASNSDKDIQQLTVSALLAQLLIHASWQSGGNNYEWWKDWK